MIKQQLQLELSQRLILTPQLQQSIKLLQMSTIDVHGELERILVENPALELVEEPTPHHPEYWGAQIQRIRYTTPYQDTNDEYDFVASIPERKTLREYLSEQTSEYFINQRERALIQILIDELNENGYLTTPLEEIQENLPLELDVQINEIERARELLMTFEPQGVGCFDYDEFFSLQLQALPETTKGLTSAKSILSNYIHLLTSRQFVKLKKILGISEEELETVIRLIRSLRPRPVYGFDQEVTHFIQPDICVHKEQGMWKVTPNSAIMPPVRVNQQLLEQKNLKVKGLQKQIQEAKWLVKNIQQRTHTIVRVAESIVARQQMFFEYGEEAMQAMVLRDVAEELALHESTISRVTSQKYLLCSRGIFELKYFFGNALETCTGGSCSATAIKAIIKRMIQQEHFREPFSDSALVSELAELGIRVARRTVTKYREAMGFPPVAQRRRTG